MLPFIVPALVQEQTIPMPPFDRCGWEKEVTDAFRNNHAVYKNHVLRLFRNRPNRDCLIQLFILGVDKPDYFLYKPGTSIVPIDSKTVMVRDAAILMLNQTGYVFDGGFTVYNMF